MFLFVVTLDEAALTAPPIRVSGRNETGPLFLLR
jgi:hypothetical protein